MQPKSYVWRALCDRCGWRFHSTDLKIEWQNYVVCETCYETRHPLDFYTTRNDAHALPFVRSDNDGIDVGVPLNPLTTTCTPITSSANIGTGHLGCMRLN